MPNCNICGHNNLQGALICDSCAMPVNSTFEFERVTEPSEPYDTIIKFEDSIGTLKYRADSVLALLIQTPHSTKTVRLPKNRYEIFLGRGDGQVVDVDLSNYGAHEFGVSRRHARIFTEGDTWMIEDLGSSNGTYVNEKRIRPEQPFIIHSGDALAFGRMKASILVLPQVATSPL